MQDDAFNREWIDEMTAQRDRILSSGALARVKSLLLSVGAHNVPALAIPLAFDKRTFEELSAAARALLSAQSKILHHLCATRSRADVLSTFTIPEAAAPFIDWDALLDGRHALSRFDVVPGNDGYYFCELNRDSAIGGLEIGECVRLYCEALGWPLLDGWDGPQRTIVRLLGETAARGGLRRVVFCDWHTGAGLGGMGWDLLQRDLARSYPHLETHIAYETTYRGEWLARAEGEKTLVYRGFLYQDMDDDGAFYRRLLDSRATVINTFETEVLISKSWFAVFWDERYRPLLDEAEIRAIERHVPRTVRIDEANLGAALREKHRWVFKSSSGCGGKGVLMGAEHDATDLRARIAEKGAAHWVAQHAVSYDGLVMPYDETFRPALHHVVLGLYVLDGNASGMYVRASRRSKVVNVSSGVGSTGWAIPMTPEERAQSIAEVRRAAASG